MNSGAIAPFAFLHKPLDITTALPSLTLPGGGANLPSGFVCSLNVLGGETVSTGIVKLKRHAEVVASLVKNVANQQLPTLNWPSLLN
jgi:hypothetical protein